MSGRTVKIAVTADIEVPRVPNFVKNGESWLPLCALSEEGLRKLGEAWTEKLVKRAREQAKKPEDFYKLAPKGDSS